MKVIIHRGAKEAGGICIEVVSGNSSILLDCGLPLSFEFGDDIKSFLPQPLFSELRDKTKSVKAVFITHAHLDHYGLAGYLPAHIPVYLSSVTKTLMEFNEQFTPNKIGKINTVEFQSYSPVKIGNLTVTPFLMDHSAFDAHGFLVEDGTKSIFYTGDFRWHGLNKSLTSEIAGKLPSIDALLMEGTILGERENELFVSEKEIKNHFITKCNKYSGPILVTVPSQNIDRIKSIYQAGQATNRQLIIDLYSAELFHRLSQFTDGLPLANSEGVSIWYPYFQRENLAKDKLYWVMKNHKKNKKQLSELAKEFQDPILFIRPPFRKEIGRYFNLSDSIWIYSMWPGYLERSEALKKLTGWVTEKNIPIKVLHTSGHAALKDLKQFASSLSPKTIIPVHSFHPDRYNQHFNNICLVADNEDHVV